MELQKFSYDNKIVKYFLYATIFWGVVGFLLGVTVASLLFYPDLWQDIFGQNVAPLGYGRLRMLHTSAVIFAFVGNAIFAGVYYSMQRLLKTRMYSDALSWANFWGWQIMIVLVVVTFFLGINTSKEYAEHEWPIDILITVVWVIFGINMFGTIFKRRVHHLYVAIWFYIATFFAVAILHIFNNLELPVSLWKSYSAYAGVQDALMQWWYGHNAVAFFLTTPVLGLMYYFVPKAANRPVFSYKLSIIHFWSLIFIYIWAGPHHLLYTALPNWTQVLGTVFSIMLIAPSWGGMLNGLLTLRGAWDKVAKDPILKFFVVALTCYGMATFEGPLLATKTLNTIGHFTNWVIAHVHVGALGWNGMIIFGMTYYLVPKMWNTKLHSVGMANAHFWLATLGIILYVIPIYWAGFAEYQMLSEFTPQGTLANKNFLETLTIVKPMYIIRAIGGVLYLTGSIIMIVNVWKTVSKGSFTSNEEVEAPAINKGTPRQSGEGFHTWLERMPVQLSIGSAIALLIGSLIEVAPTLLSDFKSDEVIVNTLTPLEVEGRDIYIKEGCNACHSQMVRPFRDEVKRYSTPELGFSKSEMFIYDHPFLWGSRRTGPDLGFEGARNPNPAWHYKHFINPRYVEEASIMPAYPWLLANTLDISQAQDKMETLRSLGVPYTDEDIQDAEVWIDEQREEIFNLLMADGTSEPVKFYEEAAGLTQIKDLEHQIIETLVDPQADLEDELAGLEEGSPEYKKVEAEIKAIDKKLDAKNIEMEKLTNKLAQEYKEQISNSEVIALIAYIRSLGTKIEFKD
ncbi:cytochrome-c oxidase [Flavobacteriaceae bacterium UJ101]|nr:cytochrome-c oxidase [Flavobacteriaceae bacterium UJ101]